MTVDLRSDTVTRPSAKMREAIASAQVGDDVYGEDPTVHALEERVAALLGKEAALFVPSGTMANQIAIAVHSRPGDEVIVSEGAHCMIYEGGAAAALSGVQLTPVGGPRGLFTAADVAAHLHDDSNLHVPRTALVSVENTHNRGGGSIFPQPEIIAIGALAHQHGVAYHLDGARLWNVAVKTGLSVKELAAPFDTVSVCLSKGLGAPVGSLLAGSRAMVARARRRRKLQGGGMRQSGLLAAAGLYALDHNLFRLAADHSHARLLAERLAPLPGVALDLGGVETNIVIWDLLPEAPLDAAGFVARARAEGLLVNAIGARRLRAVTHLDVSEADCARAAEIAAAVLRRA